MQGKTINGFTLQRLLGTGGMAEVWYAENKIGKKAAVKLLLPKFCADEVVKERFHTEAKVMVALNHSNIRQVYDYGELEGRPTIVMEYLDGSDLKARMKQGQRFTQEELVKWWNQMVDALNYTHGQDIVHRDIKPSNIFVDAEGNAKLLDFGIAKVRDSISATQTEQKLGTLMYMSPEQVRDPKRVGVASDAYSLAVTFVHLLTGKAPYDSTTDSDYDIQVSIVTKPVDMSNMPADWQRFLTPYLDKKADKRPSLKCFEIETKLQSTACENVICIGPSINSGAVFTVRNVPFVMKFVKGGTFQMSGWNRDIGELVRFNATISDYYLGETLVTQELWKAVVGHNPSYYKRNDLPVEQVSYDDIVNVFLPTLNQLTGKKFRLPTEAEWEYAARGGNVGLGYEYSGSNILDLVAWYFETTNDKGTRPVKTKYPNELGLYDMSGNVWEWCRDWFGFYDSEPKINPHGPSFGTCKVLKGGGWYDYAGYCGVSSRFGDAPNARNHFNGFRLCLSGLKNDY